MKNLLIAIIILTVLAGSVAPSNAADPGEQPTTCAEWNGWRLMEKAHFVSGYSLGAMYAAIYAQVKADKDNFANELLNELLPDKYRIGAIVLEVDVSCQQSGNRTEDLGIVLSKIAADKNATLIQQLRDKQTQRGLDKGKEMGILNDCKVVDSKIKCQ